MSFKPYSDYRARTNRYLPSVPSHWEATRFKLFAEEREERSTDGNELLLSVSEYSGVSPRSTIVDEGDHLSRAESLEGYKVCHPGDLVMNIMLAWKKAQGVSCYHGIVSPAYSVYALRGKANPRFIHYLARTQIYADYFKSFSSGVIDSRLRLYPDTFLGLKTDLPAEEEQSSIANFLDRETAKIDALIAEQQRLIELLQEKRQAFISHAVTKGLNPNALMKDSGVEWLGEVPEHWAICPLKHICKITTGFAFKSDEFQDEGIPLVRISNIQSDGTIDLKDAKRLKESELAEHPRETLKHGDIAMAMTGGTIGKSGIYSSDEPALLNQRVCVFRAKPDCSQAFLWLITASSFYQEHIKLTSFGGAQPNISDGDLLACICPMPPLEEQEEISASIDSQAAKLGKLQSKAESAIELLSERRLTLIYAAVTGQIDVRGLAEAEAGEL